MRHSVRRRVRQCGRRRQPSVRHRAQVAGRHLLFRRQLHYPDHQPEQLTETPGGDKQRDLG